MEVRKLKLLLTLTFFTTSCNDLGKLTHTIDLASFKYLGKTMFTEISPLSLQEIHLDNTNYLGQEVVASGLLNEVGQHSTYMVISNDSTKLIVVLTDIKPLELPNNIQINQQVKFWGTVEHGKGGLPYVQARMIKIAPVTPKETPEHKA